MMKNGKFVRAAVIAACTGMALSTGAFAQVTFNEVEPNDNKAAANAVVGMAPGDSITGSTTGTSTVTPGLASADYFNVTTAAAPTPGIYRYRLVITATGTAGHTGTIRGLTQTAGVPNAGTDTAVQTSSTATTPARFVQWYGNETASQIYYRVTGVAATVGIYTATLERAPVTPIVVSGTVASGSVTISSIGQTTTDTDMWLYDANFNAIAGAGNDDESIAGGGTGTTGQSRFTRSLTPGTYYLAMTNFNFANNQGSPADDDFRTGAVLDFANALANSSTTVVADVDFAITSGAGTIAVTAAKPGPFDITMAQFTVSAATGPTLSGCTAAPSPVVQGNSVLVSATATAGANPISTVTADFSAFGGSATTAMTDPDLNGVYEATLSVPGAQTPGNYTINITATDTAAATGSCTASLSVIAPPPANDDCANAITVTAGAPAASGDNTQATTGAESVSCTTIGKGVWYDFTAPSAGSFQFDTNGSTQSDTVLALFDACGGTELACDDDTGTGLLSQITFTLTSGQNVKVLVGSFGAAPTGGAFVLNIVGITTGACCNNTTGVCTIVTGGVCTGGTYQGDNTVCTPSPCPPSGSCCIGSCCSVTLQAACTGTWTSGGVCTVNPCGTPANDDCANAIALSLGVQASGDTCNATLDGVETAPTCQASHGKSVWFSFTAPATAAYSITTCGSGFDNVLSVYSGTCGATVDVACDDDACDGVTPPGSGLAAVIANVTLNAGTTYLVRVSSFGATPAGGQFVITVNGNAAFGSCCVTSTCSVTDAANCTGTFTSGGTCSPNPCAPTTGACCQGTTCSTTTAAGCTGVNTLYAGDGTVCNAFPAATSPCCLADYNHVGGITVQDIFDFLNGYFSNDPFADINGGGLSVQDIFDFLNAYFSGGC